MLLGIGFSAREFSNDELSTELNNSIVVSDSQEEVDDINLKFDKKINKSDFLASTDVNGTNSRYIDKLQAKLSYTNNNSNSNYTGNLNDYFSLYDPYNPVSENSPYLENEESQQNLYFENHYVKSDSIESTLYYQPIYPIIDTTKTTFDTTLINQYLQSIESLISPQNGNSVSFQEITMTAGSSSVTVPNYLKFYASKVKINDTTYQFRYHVFYYTTNSSKIYLASTSLGSSSTQTQTSDVTFPTVTLDSLVIKQNKRESSYIKFKTSFATTQFTIYFSCGYSNTAGVDSEYDCIDIFRTKNDFESYKTKMLTYIEGLSFNVTPTISNSTVEILSEDDSLSNLSNHNMQFIYAYVSRYKVISGSNTYYRNYNYYYFYFSLFDGNLRLLYNKDPNGLLASNNTSSLYPVVEICSNNAQTHQFGANSSNGSNFRSNISLYTYTSTSYIRTLYYYVNNSGANTNFSNFVYYFYEDSTYINIIDKSKKEKDFDFDICKKYLKDNYSYYTINGGETLEFKQYYDSNFPYLYIILTRRKTSENKYYYFDVNIFYYSTADNNNNISSFRVNCDKRYRTSLSNATNISDWFTLTLHGEDASTYPSHIGTKHDETKNTNLYFDLSYYNEKDVLVNSTNQSVNLFTNTLSTNAGDNNFIDTTNGTRNKQEDIRNQLNNYNVVNSIDTTQPIRANVYLKDGVYYFSGYYYRKNYNGRISFNNKFAFISSGYGYEYYSANQSSESGNRKFIYESDLSGYKFNNVTIDAKSQKEYPILVFSFKNL